MRRFDGKVAIVSGGGSGIGEATAKRLARDGAAVVVAAIDEPGAQRVAAEIDAAGGRAVAHVCDVAKESDVRDMVRCAVETFGRLDCLHNNAAATNLDHIGRDKYVTDMDVEIWDRTMAVNLRGPMLGCKYAIPEMIRHGGGAIVNTSSVASLFGGHQETAYGVSKAGLEALTRYVAVQYGKQGIRCNAILPSITLTPAVAANIPEALVGILRDYGNSLDRVAEPQDMADVVSFLLSDEARHVTGQALATDGGFSLVSGAAAVARFAIASGQIAL